MRKGMSVLMSSVPLGTLQRLPRTCTELSHLSGKELRYFFTNFHLSWVEGSSCRLSLPAISSLSPTKMHTLLQPDTTPEQRAACQGGWAGPSVHHSGCQSNGPGTTVGTPFLVWTRRTITIPANRMRRMTLTIRASTDSNTWADSLTRPKEGRHAGCSQIRNHGGSNANQTQPFATCWGEATLSQKSTEKSRFFRLLVSI